MYLRCSASKSTVSIEVFIEEDKVLPVGVGGVVSVSTMTWATPCLVRQEDPVHSEGEEDCY